MYLVGLAAFFIVSISYAFLFAGSVKSWLVDRVEARLHISHLQFNKVTNDVRSQEQLSILSQSSLLVSSHV